MRLSHGVMRRKLEYCGFTYFPFVKLFPSAASLLTAKRSVESSVFEPFDRIRFDEEFFEAGFATDFRRFRQLRRYALFVEFVAFVLSDGDPRLFFFRIVVLLFHWLFTLVRQVVQ